METPSDALSNADRNSLTLLEQSNWPDDPKTRTAIEAAILPAAAHYLLRTRNQRDLPIDPVARFHLGNGARLERVNFLADRSPRAMRQSHGVMVNYLYKLDDIEANHEAFSERGEVVAAPAVKRLLRNDRPARRRLPEPEPERQVESSENTELTS
jgi:malonyl-CoA decarboxylase